MATIKVDLLEHPRATMCGYARAALENGATYDDRLEFWRGSCLCLSGTIGRLATRTLQETKHGNPTFIWTKWRPFNGLVEL